MPAGREGCSCLSRAVKLASGTGPGGVAMRPNSASKKFCAEAVATEVRSVVTVMPVTRMSLTPRLKRLWRRINKAKDPPTRAPTIPRRTSLNAFGGGRKYDLRAPGVRRLEPRRLESIRRAHVAARHFFCRSHSERAGETRAAGSALASEPRLARAYGSQALATSKSTS